jgi:ATP-binding cassette subfamily B multidrug efflux pump
LNRVIRKLLNAVKPYRGYALGTLLLITLQVFTDLWIPRLIQRIIDEGLKQRNLPLLINTALWMLGLSLLSAVFAILSSLGSIRVSEGIARDLRNEVFLKVQRFSFGNLDRYSTGELMVHLSSDVSAMSRLAHMSLRMGTKGPLMMLGAIVMIFITAPGLAVYVVPLLLVAMAIVLFFSSRMEPAFRAVQEKLDKLNTVLQENIAGAELIKSYVRADYEEERFEVTNSEFTASSIHVMQFMTLMSPLLNLSVNLAIILIIWFGGLQTITGKLTTGQLVAFINYLLSMQLPLVFLVNMVNNYAAAKASGDRVIDLLETPIEVLEAPNPVSLGASPLGTLVFEDVSFHYNGAARYKILEDLSFSTEPGQVVAILGATGAGKSTLVNLIPRFYDPRSGTVKINGLDLRKVEEDSLLRGMGIVPQESVLFSGTIRENLCYGRPDASEEEVIAAAQAAQIHAFITSLPDGYNTVVKERGSNFSGGQKQRMAIARALLVQPDYLILDDSTSAVDVETEANIQEAIRKIMHGKTVFMVAQRISTVLNADKILVLDHGRIAAEGTHKELLLSSPIYREIYESQLGGGIA